ncbi:MAG: Uma2 family endonuclease [Gammaproteobacteria bacterium]|nr:Uma2 family endonuclease [Gammaproteobacteria bacterium]
MTATKPRLPYTYDDYRTLPEDMSRRYELLHGDLYRVPAPTTRHQQILSTLYSLVRLQVNSHQLGTVLFAPVDVILGQGDAREVVQPDLMFVAADRRDLVKLQGIVGPPDLVVEILSPGTEERDRGYKLKMYARHNVPEYWIVDPDTCTIDIYSAGPAEYLAPIRYRDGEVMTCARLRELRLSLRDIFAD